MSLRRPLLGAVAGLLAVALALPFAPATQAAQTCEDPGGADVQNGLEFVRIALNDTEPSAEPTQPIEFRIRNNAGPVGPRTAEVQSITATIVACKDGQALPDPSTNTVDGGTSTSLDMAWSAAFTWNGDYAVVIEAHGRRPSGLTWADQSLRVVKHIHLAVPPKKPTGVKASTANGVVTVSWSIADREPDLEYYEVRRAKQGSSEYVTVKDGLVPPTTSSVSDTPGEGAYRYQVIAYRSEVLSGATSSDATAEVAAPPPGASTDAAGAGGGTAAGSSSSSSASGGTGAGSGGTSATTRPEVTTGGAGGTVDLSHFAAVLNARRSSTTTTRVEPPDPGYEETLPFQVSGDEPVVEGEAEELGSGEEGLGERLVADPDARRRSLGFVAFGLLLFVLGMTGLFLKGEVNRAEDLEAVDHDEAEDEHEDLADPPALVPVAVTATEVAEADEPHEVEVDDVVDTAPPVLPARRSRRLPRLGPDPAELDEFTPPVPDGTEPEDLRDVLGHPADDVAPVANGSHRRRRTVAPLDAPGLDVPDPAATTRTTHARRASNRLPAGSADDRRQGRAAVRAGGGGAGEGDRRVPVGR